MARGERRDERRSGDREPDEDRAGDDERSEDERSEDEPSEDERGDGRTQAREGLSAADAGELVRRAKQQLASLTGNRLESVSGLSRDRDGWRVTIEVVELQRIPPSTDVLASYEVELDSRGNLLGYQRTRRYVRSQADEL